MASQAQLSANRSDAQRSTGPRTPQGKAVAAMNALSHGLTAVKVVAGQEDAPLFDALRDQLKREWRPGSILEVMLLDRIAELVWQLRRVAGIEVQVIEKVPKWRPDGATPQNYSMAEAMAKDFAKPNPTLLRVQMYQQRIERALHRAIRELRAMQIDRQMQDERDEDFEDAIPVPLPGEWLGEGRPRRSASERTGDVAESETVFFRDVTADRSSTDAPSPHLTSPGGRGTGNAADCVIEIRKTNPIFGQTLGLADGYRLPGPAAVRIATGGPQRYNEAMAEPLSIDQVKHVAKLARLASPPERLELFTTQLGNILGYVEQLKEVDVAGVEPLAHAVRLTNVLRDDAPGPTLDTAVALANAPDKDGAFFKVPKVIGGDEDSAG